VTTIELLSAAVQRAAGDRKLISIICPVFNEELTIPIFYRRLQAAIAPLRVHYSFELIFTDNCSTDRSREIIDALRSQSDEVQVVSLSRNFGYQASLQAGMTYAAGDAAIIIDADCEDPPEMIPQFVEKWEAGFDVVYGIRYDRPEFWPIKAARDLFYRLLQAVADMDIVLYMAEFSLISAPVRDATLNLANSFPFLRSEIGYAGFERHGIRYTRESRVAGKSNYNFARMLRFAGAGILTASTFVLRLPLYCFPVLAILNAILLFSHRFDALVTLDLLYLTLLVTFACLYLGRVYKNGIGRPNFHVNTKRSRINRDFPVSPEQALRASARDWRTVAK
jgi:polyisoprenyl-phosphate glycosyltransferase